MPMSRSALSAVGLRLPLLSCPLAPGLCILYFQQSTRIPSKSGNESTPRELDVQGANRLREQEGVARCMLGRLVFWLFVQMYAFTPRRYMKETYSSTLEANSKVKLATHDDEISGTAIDVA